MKVAPISRLLVLALILSTAPRSRAAEAGEPEPAPVPLPVATSTNEPPASPWTTGQVVPDPVEVAADALLVRPLGLAATVVGGAIYLVALPFAAIAGDTRTPAKSLVGSPARFTFKRRLGDFSSAAR